MKRLFLSHGRLATWLLLTACALFFIPQTARSNDYLELQKHYSVMATGADVIHFKIPVWAYGKSFDYYIGTPSYAYIQEINSGNAGSKQKIAEFDSDRYDENEDKNNTKGTAYLKMLMGDAIVTSMHNGVKQHIQEGSYSNKMIVKQKDDDDCPQVTLLEFDWYPPHSLNGKQLRIGIYLYIKKSYTGNVNYEKDFTFGDNFSTEDNMLEPQLYTPYLYTLNETGVAGYGYAAVPFITFQDTKSYKASFEPKVTWPNTNRSGNIYVPTTDTVQEQIYADFQVVRNSQTKDTITLRTNKVDILPYHRIYDFTAMAETDSTGTFTGNNVLRWTVKNPSLKDLMEGDFYEIQRALKSDYSDAQQIGVVSMTRGITKQKQYDGDTLSLTDVPATYTYTFTDNSRDSWTGNADVKDLLVKNRISVSEPRYVVYDNEGKPLVELNVTLSADSVHYPGVPVYYRIRRASSSAWGWNHDFAQEYKLTNLNFLAPLAQQQDDYTQDADYANNHKVNFRFKIENKEARPKTIDINECTLTYKLNRVLKNKTVSVSILFEQGQYCSAPAGNTRFRVTDANGQIVQDWEYLSGGTYLYPANSKLEVQNTNKAIYNNNKVFSFRLSTDSKIRCATEWRMATDEFFAYFTQVEGEDTDIISEIEPYLYAIKDSLYKNLVEAHTQTYGRCMWDRTASLVLQRTIEETGLTQEFIIPQDSILRQADGSWIASFSDIADRACSHYRYAVRIDQSQSDLHVQDSSQLTPIHINGPSLYFDEAAQITDFTASQGDATTAMKNGVLLRWEVNSNAVDEFVLTRIENGSDASADTVYRGMAYYYMDRSAVPDKHYLYTLTATYSCNGKTTDNAASAEGWRTPYGEISGAILMPDNSGMAGVKVALQDEDGNTIRTMLTDATGAYKFDSLEYHYSDCDEPTLTLNASNVVNRSTIMIRVSDADGNILEEWSNKSDGTYTYKHGTVIEAKTTYSSDNAYNKVHTFILNNHSNLTIYTSGPIGMPRTTQFAFREVRECKCELKNKSYAVVPTSQYGVFSYNNTSAQTATVSISPSNATASGIDFVNTSATRLTGRVLYKMSTIPVAGAMFLLNGDTVRRGNTPVTTGIDGNFELVLPLGQQSRLQVFKSGHIFEGDGILRVESDNDEFTLDKPLDGVRFYDMTKVRLTGRVAGGNDQRDLPEGFGLGKNNLGEDVQLVLQLEGDNTSQIVHDPDDLTRDTIHSTTAHIVYSTDPLAAVKQRIVGQTKAVFEKKRIILMPDPETGEYQIDLFPVKYKVVQASAKGYATLFAAGQGSETFDLTNAPLEEHIATYDNEKKEIVAQQHIYSNGRLQTNEVAYQLSLSSQLAKVNAGDSIRYNAVYDRIYHAPVTVSLTQVLYGIEKDGFGEEEMEVSTFNLSRTQKVRLYEKQADGKIAYLLGNPVFVSGRKYQFIARAYEQYFFNNDRSSAIVDIVPERGGSITIHNGLHSATQSQTYVLDEAGENKSVSLIVDKIDTENSGTNALRTVSAVLQTDGNYVETTALQAFVSGTDIQEGELMQTESEVVLLDIVRDPGGNGSSAWVESGTTYNFSYSESYDWNIGVQLNLNWGVNISQDIGAVAAPSGAGTYTGSTFESSRLLSLPIPISHEWKWGYKYNCAVTTTERISTSSGHAKNEVGGMNDVFVGTTVSQIAGKAKTVSIVDDSMYIARKPALDAGVMKTLGQGTTADGKHYYLVTGQKVVLGSRVGGTFAYTQAYILNTLIPKLALERKNLLMNFPDYTSAQNYANQTGEAVYWNIGDADKTSDNDSIQRGKYRMVVPDNGRTFTNRIAAIDNMIGEWVTILYGNEKEKVDARMAGKGSVVGTWSVSSGTTVSHSDSYTATANYNELPQSGLLFGHEMANNATSAATQLITNAQGIFKFFSNSGSKYIGTTVHNALLEMARKQGVEDTSDEDQQQTMGTVSNTSKFSFTFKPLLDYDSDYNISEDKTIKKSTGFTLGADTHGDITVAVYRARVDSVWQSQSQLMREQVQQGNNTDLLYGSYVFFTEAGSSYCPHEAEEKTLFYNPGTTINNETQWIHKPEMSIDTYEQTAVMPDKKATFRLTMMDNGQVQTGIATNGIAYTLSLFGQSNPNGAKIWMDGAPLITSVPLYLYTGQAVTKVIEVERGTADDYNDLTLILALADCPKTNATLSFSVHFLPEASEVEITMPRQNWIMNTLSQHDSAGYYLPVEIDGFDIHHKNFDHIEFQYKLSTESEEMWVNQCSFYANDSLYALATGNKAMIENGRIAPFRFYGERDPMEQRYDLRAVSFCRYGSGFVTKASPVVSGIKDTRPPRVFGEPEPVNAILGVGEHLRLRFNEPIAGNYLDEDNNFQLVGVTNSTGITTNASVHFDGTSESYAATQVNRSLEARSYTIDMIVRPTSPTAEVTFFEHGFEREGVVFGRTADNRLQLQMGTYSIYSKPLTRQMLDFTRVALVYNYSDNTLRFYAGTEDITDPDAKPVPDVPYNLSAPLVFGRGMDGNMLEVRLWTKPLTQEEIAATNGRYLTGYEQELVAYYKMNEGTGNTAKDLASGATLQLHGASWNLPKGISLALSKSDSVALATNLLARSEAYDATYMLWFRNKTANGTVFRAGDKHFTLNNGNLQWWLNDSTSHSLGGVGTDEWHHLVLAINRTYNNTAVYIDGKMQDTYPATQMTGITGDMYFGGKGFEGNIDEFVVFEQALPKTIIEEYGNRTPMGDEMGLMAYLPFEQQRQNANGILELIFSTDDRRIIKDANGNQIDKQVPLLSQPISAEMSDKSNYAPVHGFGLLSKLNFDWAFNQDELLINLKMADREINKQTVCVTVRDVEDMNGNPMPSPVMWVAYVDRNSLTWDNNTMSLFHYYGNDEYDDIYNYSDMRIVNNSGKRHQFTIESLPEWLSVDQSFGTIQPIDDYTVRFYYDTSLPVGEYNDLVYVTDENGLSEPLKVTYTVRTYCPWNEPDRSRYALNMSLCGQLIVNGTYSTNPEDKIIALYRNECVGMTNISFDNSTNKSDIFLTVYGNEQMKGKEIVFLMWQASTGKVLSLNTSQKITFAHGNVFGCNGETLLFTTGGSEVQNISLNAGWNWTSFNIGLYADATGVINNVMTASTPWNEGDAIKNPVTRNFCTYSDSLGKFVGSLYHFRYVYTHMIYSQSGNIMRVSGNKLPTDSMRVILRGDGAWSPLPCLYSEPTSITEALADYFDNASIGDVVKSHDRFAVFSQDKKWVGNLSALHPGEGYFFRRTGKGDVILHYYQNSRRSKQQRAPMIDDTDQESYHNPDASTNMTMIAKIEGKANGRVLAFVGSELAGIATEQMVDGDTLYWLTIQSDKTQELQFRTEQGTTLRVRQNNRNIDIPYTPDAHIGTLNEPSILVPDNEGKDAVYKIYEKGNVYIIRQGDKYTITGIKITK